MRGIIRLVFASLIVGFGTLSVVVLPTQVASAAAVCTFNGQTTVVPNVTPGGTIAISCTGLPHKTTMVAVEASALAGLVVSANQTDEADVNALGLDQSSSTGTLAYNYVLPTTFAATDPAAQCPPTQAQVNAGLGGCSLSLATFADVSYGTVTLDYTTQPSPQPPTLALSPTSACAGQQVTVSDGAGPGDWWGNADAVTPLSSADISVGGIAPASTSASISAASYNYSPPSPLVPPMLSGSFVIPSGAGLGTQTVTVTEPNITGIPGTVSASVPLTIVACNVPQTISFTSTPPLPAFFDGPSYAVSATASSGLPVVLTVDASAASVCSLTASMVSFIGVGTCEIDANQSGNDTYDAAPEAQQSFAVSPATPSTPIITNIPGSGDAIVGGSFIPTVSTTGDGTTSVTSSTPWVCGVSSGTVNYLGAGTCSLVAQVTAGTDYTAADGSPQSFDVGPEASSTSLTSSGSPSTYSQAVTFTATVSPTDGGGTVGFSADGNTLTDCATQSLSLVSGGYEATCTTTSLAAGSDTINAAYQGDTNFSGSSGTLTQAVNKTPTVTTVRSSKNPSTYGSSVTFTATVSPTDGGGTMTFWVGGNTIVGCTSTPLSLVGPSYKATCTTSSLAGGSDKVRAVYSGDRNAFGSSGKVTQTVSKSPTSTVITSSKNPSKMGHAVTFTATVSPTDGLGTISFSAQGSPITSCTKEKLKSIGGKYEATCKTSSLASGTETIEATYSGDSAYSGSSGSLTQRVKS